MQLVFQNLLQEQDRGVLEASQALWRVLLQRAGSSVSLQALLPAPLLTVLGSYIYS